MIKQMTNWKIIRTTGNTVSLLGDVNGVMTQTTPIVQFRKNEVKTKNTHYQLSDMNPGMWVLELQIHRKEIYEKMCAFGLL